MPLFFQKDNPLSALGRKNANVLISKKKEGQAALFLFLFLSPPDWPTYVHDATKLLNVGQQLITKN